MAGRPQTAPSTSQTANTSPTERPKNQSVRLQGNAVNSDIWQNVSTTAGETYLLQFDWAG